MTAQGGGVVLHVVDVRARGRQPAATPRQGGADQPLRRSPSRSRREDPRERDRAGLDQFPGGVWEMIKQATRAYYDSIQASIPWGRLGTDTEVANAIVFAASPRASWITGAVLAIDGGQHKGNL
jgi:3-oxoacyl-[acyl-carrier protein] reductase